MNEDAKTKAITAALQYVHIGAVGGFEGGPKFLSDFWDKSRDAALKEAEKMLDLLDHNIHHNDKAVKLQNDVVISEGTLNFLFDTAKKRLRGKE